MRLRVPLSVVLLAAALVGFGGSTAASARPRKASATGWEDQFDSHRLDPRRWVIANGYAPGYIANNHRGYMTPDNVWLQDGYLVLRVTQQIGTVDSNTSAVVSYGGAVYTKGNYPYGTYEWRMRMSTVAEAPELPGTGDVTGSVSAGFVYTSNSETEIDFEYSGTQFNTLLMTNWHNLNPASEPSPAYSTHSSAPLFGITENFHTYKFVWTSSSITYSVDDVVQAVHTTNVPSAPAAVVVNHWGTNSRYFGGAASVGVTRYLYVDWVRYTPLP